MLRWGASAGEREVLLEERANVVPPGIVRLDGESAHPRCLPANGGLDHANETWRRLRDPVATLAAHATAMATIGETAEMQGPDVTYARSRVVADTAAETRDGDLDRK